MTFPQGHVFPTRKEEKWKYTSLKTWLEKPYTLGDSKGRSPHFQSSFDSKLVFVNGCFKQELSRIPHGVTLSSQKSSSSQDSDSLVRLNAEFTQETTLIQVAPHTFFENPMHLVFVSLSDKSPSMNYPQVRLEVGEESKALFLIQHETDSDQEEVFVSSWFQADIKKQAHVEIVFLQNQNLKSFHYEKAQIKVAEAAQVKILEVAIGSLLSRSEAEIEITGPDASAYLLGVYALAQNQQSDHYTSMRHLVGGSQTVQIYKGLLNDQSKGVFNGHVYIAQDAQKANSEQLNKNLLLSSQAEANSKPELEIYADDVKATHGSTIGQIQKEEVFYLQTRGIKKEKAIQLVSEAFVMDVVHQLENVTLKDAVRKVLQAKGAIK